MINKKLNKEIFIKSNLLNVHWYGSKLIANKYSYIYKGVPGGWYLT